MKFKILLYIIGVILLIIAGILFYKWFFNQPCIEPNKPENVPYSAIWKGSCDGGNWIELVSVEKEKIRFRIYRDWNGDLILDADFKYQNCDSFRLDESNWHKHIAYFENHSFILYNNGKPKECVLGPIYPAYSEDKLE